MSRPLSRVECRKIAALCEQRWEYFYSRAKLRSDPVYAAVAHELADCALPVLDIGCGIGLLGQYLRQGGHAAPIMGFDYDARKIDSAQRVAAKSGHAGLDFASGDARDGLPAFTGNVVILDILQFFTRAEQESLLRAAADRVAPAGRLIIRSTLRDDSWRFRVTFLGDVFAKVTRWMKELPTLYPDAEQFRAVLAGAGLAVEFTPLWGKMPFNNYLIIGRRSPPAKPEVSSADPAQ